MILRLCLFILSTTVLLSCNQQKPGLNPVVNQVDSFLLVQKIINHLEQSKIEKITRLKFVLHSLQDEDSSSRFLFTITNFQLDPVPPYLSEVINFDSLRKVLVSSPYHITVNIHGRIASAEGEVQMQKNLAIAFTDRHISNRFMADYFSANAVQDIINRLFSATSHKTIKEGDNWVRDLVYVTKAPVEVSNLFACQKIKDDSVFIRNKALVSANQGDASSVYMKGEQSGEFVISAATGLPYLINTHAMLVTSTTGGDLKTEDIFEIRRLN